MPPLQFSLIGHVVMVNQFEPLVQAGKNGLIEPLAAASWDISKDHLTVRFKIDPNRKFSDGTSLQAADFKRSWEDGLRLTAVSTNKSLADALCNLKGFESLAATGHIEGIRVLGKDILELEFKTPIRSFLGDLAGVRCAAYRVVEGHPIGTGPYIMQDRGSALDLRPNPYYSGAERRFEAIRIVVTSPAEAADKLRTGDVDATLFAEKLNISECEKGNSDRIHCVFGQESDHVAIDVNGLPGGLFADRRNRLALQALILERLQNGVLPAALQQGHFVRDPQSFLPFQPGRIADADADRLGDAGRKDIARLKKLSKAKPIYLISGTDCDWLIRLLTEAGLSVSPLSGRVDYKDLFEIFYHTQKADLLYGNFSVYTGDPDGLYHALGKHGAIASPMTSRASVADLLEKGRTMLDRAALPAHYAKVGREILAEVPYVHLGYKSRAVAYNAERTRIAESFVMRENTRMTIFEPR
jgi:ABC-type transport system substrate-binding protein